MTALCAETGKVLWNADHLPSGYRSPEDMLVVNGLVWTGENTSGRAEGILYGHDPRTGEIKKEFLPDLDIYWFHHRCYRGKATDQYLMTSRAGVEFIDVENEEWEPHHWVRGACLYGIMPANGLMYSPPNPCACYLEAMINGFSALAPAAADASPAATLAGGDRLTRGSAYGWRAEKKENRPEAGDWPAYRHDPSRSGATDLIVPAEGLRLRWQATPGGRLTQPVVADGRIHVASIDTHTLHTFDAHTGEPLWRFVAGARIDSAPTLFRGKVYLGSCDGSVYCLRGSDGALVWQFLAAPEDQRLMGFEQVESVWPVHGSVLVLDGPGTASGRPELWCLAGRSMFIDGGLGFWRLDAETGEVLWKTRLNETDQETGKHLQDYVSWLNMPTARPDILSSDGRFVYMRSQPFHPDGTRLPLKPYPRGENDDHGTPEPTQDPEYSHIFCPTGFLDDSWWHRTYWLYGSMYISGWCGYYQAGKVSPAGRILAIEDDKVYGFGRKPEYYRWTTPIEHHLFCADRITPMDSPEREGSLVVIGKSKSLNPAGKPLTVEAFVNPLDDHGVVFADGGSTHGYALYLTAGKPIFSVRVKGDLYSVEGEEGLDAQWYHLAGRISEGEEGKELHLFVNGDLVASATAKGFLEGEPAEGLSIGADQESSAGKYEGPYAFKGLIDEVRVYSRGLDDAEIKAHADLQKPMSGKEEGLVLWYSFEAGKAEDLSGNNNDGDIKGVVAVAGRIGDAFEFTGKERSTSDFKVRHHWTTDLPILARGLVKCKDTLFVAGPLDLVDEEEIFWQIDESKVKQALLNQEAAINGKSGGKLLAVSAADGKELSSYDLTAPPVFDGLIAANNNLYIATVNGTIVCYGKK